MSMRVLPLVAILISQLAQAGTYLKEVQTTGGLQGMPQQTFALESWYEGDHVKRVMLGPDNNPMMVFLMDTKKQEVLLLNPAGKTYAVMPPELYQQGTQTMLQAFGVARNPDGTYSVPKNIFQKTGIKKKIGSWKCYEVKVHAPVLNGGKMTMWFTNEVGLNQADYVKTLKAQMGTDAKALAPFFNQFSALNGYPALVTTEMEIQGQRLSSTQELKQVKKLSIADKEFEIPAGYTKVDPGMAAGGALAPSPPAETKPPVSEPPPKSK
ncbi:MAG: DUF4412 domain-containing protein [Deltaproteobacteria bacterium]|nr:DUF4412 domain-containing protein [Deltaproteobacteria bacterium]